MKNGSFLILALDERLSGQIQPTGGFVDKVLLESSQALSLMYCLWLAFMPQMAELSSDDRDCLTHTA